MTRIPRQTREAMSIDGGTHEKGADETRRHRSMPDDLLSGCRPHPRRLSPTTSRVVLQYVMSSALTSSGCPVIGTKSAPGCQNGGQDSKCNDIEDWTAG